MKKVYFSPEIDVIDIELESILAASAETGSGSIKGDDDGTGEVLAKEHNNVWEEWEE